MLSRDVKNYIIFFLLLGIIFVAYYFIVPAKKIIPQQPTSKALQWIAPDTSSIPFTSAGNLIRYGRDLMANTSHYLGPKGTVAVISNGMNCQNCHLDAGTRPYGNSFASVAGTYPKFRERSGKTETIAFRINECMERSMNGKQIDSNSKEMNAMIAYLQWLGKEVPKGHKLPDAGIVEIEYISRAADILKGRNVFITHCQSCHGSNGEGLLNKDSSGYTYPPVWGPYSYNVSAGMYRISRLAAFVKNNMPFNRSLHSPQLTNEEAWDVAAFINTQQRPQIFFNYDWPVLQKKPVDYPFGPYTDSFSVTQHKYGPFDEIKKQREAKNHPIK